MSVRVEHGDCRDVIKTLAEASIDSVVTDPPYSLVSIQKRFGKPGSAAAQEGKDGLYRRASAGFMGASWDTGETAFDPDWWREVFRVMKPGAHLVAFSGTRTYHRMACAIEDAGFEIRDQLAWAYGSGFPKSHNVGKAIDKAAGVEREVVGRRPDHVISAKWREIEGRIDRPDGILNITTPATDAAKQWEGWGTALKPAWEPICLARKPLIGTVVANVLQHGTGALNIEGCRVPGTPDPVFGGRKGNGGVFGASGKYQTEPSDLGRWPANVIHDGSDEVMEAFPQSAGQLRAVGPQHGAKPSINVYGDFGPRDHFEPRGDSGSAARFFYGAKRSVDDTCLCDLCGSLTAPISCNVEVCNAQIAEPSSPPNGKLLGSAPSDAVANSSPAVEGRNHLESPHAQCAESNSDLCQAPNGNSALVSARCDLQSRIVQAARFAANLCDCCAIAIAQSLAATLQGRDPASPLCPVSISEQSKQTLIRSLALYVEGRDNTGIMSSTSALRTLFGFVFPAIADTITKEKREAKSKSPPAARFHYSSKAGPDDRCDSKHPTIKPVALMRWLARLVTQPDGTVLDPFAGSGTTGVACLREGFNAILIERDDQYVADIRHRLDKLSGLDAPLFAVSQICEAMT